MKYWATPEWNSNCASAVTALNLCYQLIIINVTNEISGNVRRRDDIRKYWFFDCECRRCVDPTELGTHMSSIRCFTCSTGFLLPSEAIVYNCDWKCESCGATAPHATVDEVLSTIEQQVFIYK